MYVKRLSYPMELGLSTWTYHSIPIETAIITIRKHAPTIHHLELWGNTPIHVNPVTCTLQHIATLNQLLRTNHLIPQSCHAPFDNLDLSDPSRNKLAIQAVIQTMLFCREIECSTVIVHISASPGVKTLKELQRAKECTIKTLKTIIDYPDTHHIKILLENLVPRPMHMRLGAEIEDLIDIAQTLDPRRVGICIDTGHSLLNKHDPCSDIQKAGNLLKSLHINDNDGLEDLHLVPGNGIINWNRIYQTLQNIHYQGIFLLEVAGRTPVEQIVHTAIDYSRNLLHVRT